MSAGPGNGGRSPVAPACTLTIVRATVSAAMAAPICNQARPRVGRRRLAANPIAPRLRTPSAMVVTTRDGGTST